MPLAFLSPTSPLPFYLPFFRRVFIVRLPLVCLCVACLLVIMSSTPIIINPYPLERVMQRLEIIENKVAMVELVENLDRKIHNEITQYGSKVGVILIFLRKGTHS